MNCPNCGVPCPPELSACDVCETQLPSHCQHCGLETPNGVDICIHCRTESMLPEPGRGGAEARFEVPEAVLPAGLNQQAAFVGRHSTLQTLAELHQQSREDRRFRFTTLVGAAGSGKTRLVAQLAGLLGSGDAGTRPSLLLTGPAGGRGAPPYSAFIRGLAGAFGFEEGQPLDRSREQILKGVEEVLPGGRGEDVAHLLGQLMRVPFQGSKVVEPLLNRPAELEMRIFIAMRRFFGAHAERGTVALVFDDMERATAETVNLLHYLATGLANSPVLAVLVGRPEVLDLHPRWGQGEYEYVKHEIGELEPDDAASLLQALLVGCEELPEALDSLVRGRLERSPRTLVELVRLLLEAGIIDASGEAWRIDIERLSALDVPTTHEGILKRRLASLAQGDREVLEKAAAIGDVFWLDAVVALVRSKVLADGERDGPTLEVIADTGDRTHHSVREALKRHVTRGLIVPNEVSQIRGHREYHFSYPPLWELVYEGSDAIDRVRYHQVVAQWLELRPEGRFSENQEEVARHLERAGDGARAADHYQRAADLARTGHYNDRALRLYTEALNSVADYDVGTRMNLWHELGSVHALRGDYEEALDAFEKMLRLSWLMNSRSKGGAAFNKMGRIHRQKGDLELALQYLERGKALFKQAGDERGLAGSLDDIGQCLRLQGHYDEALEKTTVALEARRRFGDQRSIAVSLTNIGNIERDRGLMSQAASYHEEALETRRDLDDREGVVLSLNALAVIDYFRGNRGRAVERWQEALHLAEVIGAIPMQAMLLNNLGEAALATDEPQRARQRLEEAVKLACLLDDRRVLTDALRNLSDLDIAEGNYARALTNAQESLQVARKAGMREYVGRALLALGVANAALRKDEEGATEEARRYFSEAVEVFRELDNQTELARALEHYGDFLNDHGNPDGGAWLRQEANELTQKLGLKLPPRPGKS